MTTRRPNWRAAVAMMLTYGAIAAGVWVAKDNPIGDNPPFELACVIASLLIAVVIAAWGWALDR